jgi:hypothetical protein
MTFEERLAMWAEKKMFIDALDRVFQMKPAGSLIEKIEYEVYQKEIGGAMRFKEWLVLRFEGGAMLAAQVTGNSNIANLRAISTYLDGGYYEEVRMYNFLPDLGWELLAL